ncbi:MAG: DoxX family protein [Pseudomonadota bacterium]
MTTLAQENTTAASASSITSKDALALGGRILLAAIFIFSGVTKLGQAEGTIGYIASVGLPFAEPIYYAVVALEIVGGVLLVIGYKTRLTAYALAGFSLMAAAIFHSDFADQNQLIHFLKNLALVGGLLQVAVFGPGKISLNPN